MGFLDLHSHVLPGIDDGARDLQESIALLHGLAALGFEQVCATPHQKDGSFMPTADEIADAFNILQGSSPLPLVPAAENYWGQVLFERMPALAFPKYGELGRAFLFEVAPRSMPPAPMFEEQLFRLRTRGVLPVMAHPERYWALQRDHDRAGELAKTAALVVDLGALGGAHGEAACVAARAFVESGVASAAASDVHRGEDLQEVADGLSWLRRRFSDDQVRRLLEDTPRRILAGELPETNA